MRKKIGSNPYVYPHTPFKYLNCDYLNITKKDVLANQKMEVNFDEIFELAKSQTKLDITISGNSIAEKVYNIFIEDKILFGPVEYIEDNKGYWIEKIQYFINRDEKIQFTLLGFPFKMPVPLKTMRTLPDMGEVIILARLHSLMQLIGGIYSGGAEITVFTEGGLGKFVGVSEKETVKYAEYLTFLNKKGGFDDYVKLRDLADMEKDDKFQDIFKINIEQSESEFQKKTEKFMKKFNGTKPSMERIVNTRQYSDDILMQIYDYEINSKAISAEIKSIRKEIKTNVEKAIMGYFAYLKTRDDLDFLEKTIPHYLALSVSPKPKRLGIIAVNINSNKLPYHAVAVYHEDEDCFSMEYLIDIKISNCIYKPVYLKGDEESVPFYFIKNDNS
jgi:pyoverdine/dityrosine biosynthesis protein Dit1